MMSEQNKAVARRFFEGLNSQQLVSIDELFAGDAVVRGNHLPEARGLDGIKELFSGIFSAFPDVEYRMHSVLGDGDEVSVRWTATGSQRGEWMGAVPSGKRMTVNGTITLRFANHKIVEHWVNWDALGQMLQLGVSPDVLAR